MVDNPTPPVPPTGPSPPEGQDPTKGKIPGKGFHAKPMTWLGMHFNSEEATKLWQVIIQSVNSEIGKTKEKALKALKKMKNSINGDDSD